MGRPWTHSSPLPHQRVHRRDPSQCAAAPNKSLEPNTAFINNSALESHSLQRDIRPTVLPFNPAHVPSTQPGRVPPNPTSASKPSGAGRIQLWKLDREPTTPGLLEQHEKEHVWQPSRAWL
uniref:Uncharacterized protein n=1 Tax=Knipowitschia caucasica TaxID=637954 RepID=A0AAV2M8S8_KNICA